MSANSPNRNSAPQTVNLFGATGVIGQICLRIIRQYPDRFILQAISGHTQQEQLARIAAEFNPRWVVAHQPKINQLPKNALGSMWLDSNEGLLQMAAQPADISVMAIATSAALKPIIAAIPHSKRIALANKESIIMAGQLMRKLATQHNTEIIPIDSEHSGLMQLLHGIDRSQIAKLIITASGGPFWQRSSASFDQITVTEALAHPVWKMGKKITIDSATLMNKGLELIEAQQLFSCSPEQLATIIHPQASVHAMLKLIDQQMLLHVAAPNMDAAVALALSWPQRLTRLPDYNILQQNNWQFLACDLDKFPCLRLAQQAMRAGPSAVIKLNAANEVAVASFINEQIRFTDIPRLIESCLASAELSQLPAAGDSSTSELSQISALDEETRSFATGWINKLPVSA